MRWKGILRRGQHPVFWVYNLPSKEVNLQTQHVGSLWPTSIQVFNNMAPSHCCLLRSSYNIPPLSAILHGSNPISFEDGLFLPSSCHGRTWLLDNFQETCSENTSSPMPSCDQEPCTEDGGAQSARLSRVVQTTRSNPSPREGAPCRSGTSSAALNYVVQTCQSESSLPKGSPMQTCRSVSYVAKCCPPKTYVSKSCQAREGVSSQCQTQSPASSSCSPVVSVTAGPQLLESSSSYEPSCCVTGGLQLPSKWRRCRMCWRDNIF